MNNELVYGIKPIIYGSSLNNNLLFKSVKNDGSNLTIMILTCNRSIATIKLLESIKVHISNFKGDILIIDNNSGKEDLLSLKSYCNKNLKKYNVKIIESKINLGVAGGRNYGFKFVKTEWIMSLDNDIYFINNPLPQISTTIGELGCKFLNLPLLNENGTTFFANGGNLYFNIENNTVFIGGGSMFKQQKYNLNSSFEASLSTFIFGGASVYKKSTFEKMGMYDENYFIGFEDTDLSIRIFEEGLKIGNCPTASLIHNHVFSKNISDINYEKTRYSTEIIKKSADYFEKKWGFCVWNANLEMWLNNRRNLLKIDASTPMVIKKKIALVIDVKYWAFWNIAMQIKKNLSYKYDVQIIIGNNFDDINLLFIYLKNFDLCHFFWRGHFLWLQEIENKLFMEKYGMPYNYFYTNFILNRKSKITTSIYDHLYIQNIDEINLTNKMLSYVCNYTVCSNILNKEYISNNKINKKPLMKITDGVDLNLFKPNHVERFEKNEFSKFTIGWVGNSAWNKEKGDCKGFNTILKPVIKKLKKEINLSIEENYADKQIKMIRHEDMPKYYEKIDILVCVSETEGTPNPVLEAMACGVPIISTNVGIVNEAFGPLQKKMILKNRTKICLEKKIRFLIQHPEYLKKLSIENLEYIKHWDWKYKTKEFEEFFDKCLSNEEVEV